MEEYTSIVVADGTSNSVSINYPGEFLIEVVAEHWGNGTVSIERSPINRDKFGVLVRENDEDFVLSKNNSAYVPGIGKYRAVTTNYSSMSGVEILFYPHKR